MTFSALGTLVLSSTVLLHGWDLLQTTPEEVLANAGKFDDLGCDGVTLVMRCRNSDGKDLSSLTFMDDPPWTDAAVARHVPIFKKIVAHKSLSRSYLATWWSPKKRLDWKDDARWTAVPRNWLYDSTADADSGFFGLPLFSGLGEGPFTTLTGPYGTWTADDGCAAVTKWDRGWGLRILGGVKRTVSLRLAQPTVSDEVVLLAERYTADAPFEFTIKAKAEDGSWRSVCPRGGEAPVGRLAKLEFVQLPQPVTEYRFCCTSAAGVLLGVPGECAYVADAFFQSRF